MKTARVRIAVVIDDTGKWSAYGYKDARDDEMADTLYDDIGVNSAQFFIEADVPIPKPQTIRGEVLPNPGIDGKGSDRDDPK